MGKIFVFLLLFLLPVMIGAGVVTGTGEEKRISNYYINGIVILLFGICIVFQLGKIYNFSFESQKMIYGIGMVFCTLIAMGVGVKEKTLQRTEKIKWYIIAVMLIGVVLLAFLQMQGYVYVSAFDQNDVTVESVNTILVNPFYYKINPYTGTSVEMTGCIHEYSPLQLFYAVLCGITGTQSSQLIHFIVPFWVLITCAVIVYAIGMAFFKDRKKAMAVVILVCALNIFGAGQFWLNSEYLLFKAWRDEAVEVTVVLPILLLQVCKTSRNGNRIVKWILLGITVLTAALICAEGSFYITVLGIIICFNWSAKKIYEHNRLDKSGT